MADSWLLETTEQLRCTVQCRQPRYFIIFVTVHFQVKTDIKVVPVGWGGLLWSDRAAVVPLRLVEMFDWLLRSASAAPQGSCKAATKLYYETKPGSVCIIKPDYLIFCLILQGSFNAALHKLAALLESSETTSHEDAIRVTSTCISWAWMNMRRHSNKWCMHSHFIGCGFPAKDILVVHLYAGVRSKSTAFTCCMGLDTCANNSYQVAS